MTIDEAIKDLEYGTEQLETEIKSGLWVKGSESELSCKEGIALNKQHIEWLTELKEAKRLLKAAVEDMYNSVNDVHCKYCSKWHTDQCQGTSHLDCYIENKFKWRYADEALKLIGEEGENDEKNI